MTRKGYSKSQDCLSSKCILNVAKSSRDLQILTELPVASSLLVEPIEIWKQKKAQVLPVQYNNLGISGHCVLRDRFLL